MNNLKTTAPNLGQPEQFKIGDRIEFLCDISFGDINTKAKNPDAKLALRGECAEVCGVRGTRLALSVGGEPFDWPMRLVKKIEPATKFKIDDKVRDTFPHGRPRTGTIADTREKYALIHWDGVSLENSPNGQQWSYEYLEKIEIEPDAKLDPKWSKPRQSKPILPTDALIAVVLFAGGGGVEAGMVEAGIRPVVAVEYNPKKPKLSSAIADSHDHNFKDYGCQLERKTVQEISALGFPGFPKNPDFLHASPMCSNFSNAKAGDAVETAEDIEMAKSVAIAIRKLQPKIFTLENVKRYQNSQSFKIIAQALQEEGYKWHGEVITLLDYQSRQRFVVRATRGWLPNDWHSFQPMGWHEVVADLIPLMEDSELVSLQKEALEKFLATNKPTPLLIDRVGGRGGYKAKPGYLPCNTILRSHFTDGKGANRNRFADIWLPDGTVKSLSIAAAARLQGFPDWYEFPPDTATAGSIIGYSVPPKFAAKLFKSIIEIPESMRFAYRQLRQRGVGHQEALKILGSG